MDKLRAAHAAEEADDPSEDISAAVAEAVAELAPLQKEAAAAAATMDTDLAAIDAHVADSIWFSESLGQLTTEEFCARYPLTAEAADEGVRAEMWGLTDPLAGVNETVAAMSEEEMMAVLNERGEKALVEVAKRGLGTKALSH